MGRSHYRGDLRAAFVLLVMAMLVAGGCNGRGPATPAAPGAGPIPAESPASLLAGIPPPPEDAYVAPADILARRADFYLEDSRLGDDEYLRAANTNEDTVTHTMYLFGADKTVSWAMYQFSGLVLGDLPLQAIVNSVQLPNEYWVGYSDYARGSWRWANVDNPSGQDTVGISSTTQTISPGGNFYIMVAVYGVTMAEVGRVTLGTDVLAPAPADFSASDGFSGAKIVLSWTDLALTYPGLAYNYVRIERADAVAGPWTQLAELPAGATSYDDVHDGVENVIPYNTPMYYRAITVASMLPGRPCAVDDGLRLLHDVQNLQASDGADPLAVNLSWDHVEGAQSYQIDYCCISGGTPVLWTSLTQVFEPSLAFAHTADSPLGFGAVEGEEYSYRAKARYALDLSLNWSAEDSGFRNALPIAQVTADPTEGNPPLTVLLDASGSYDPGGGALKWYEWDFDGDGSYDTNKLGSPSISHEYLQNGTFTPTVRVTDDENDTAEGGTQLVVSGVLHTWGGSGAEVIYAAAPGNNGSYYAGSTASYGSGQQDVLLLRFDAAGQFEWARTWGYSGVELARGMALDSSGNVWLAGETNSVGSGSKDVLVLEYDAAGNLLLQRVWGGASAETAYAITALGANMLVAGETTSFGAGGNDMLLLRFDTSGAVDWEKTFGTASDETAHGLACDRFNRVLLTGATNGAGQGGFDVAAVGLNSDGTKWWAKTWGGAQDDIGWGAGTDTNDLYVAVGTQSFGAGSTDAVLLRFTPGGGTMWQYGLGRSGADIAYGVAVQSAGNVFVIGSCQETSLIATDLLLYKVTSVGSLAWAKTYGTAGTNQSGNVLAYSSDANYRLGGLAQNNLAEWSEIAPTFANFTGTFANFTGTELKIVSGTLWTPEGNESAPTGVLDTGGGVDDGLMGLYDTSHFD